MWRGFPLSCTKRRFKYEDAVSPVIQYASQRVTLVIAYEYMKALKNVIQEK
jgi:hypothetical protein